MAWGNKKATSKANKPEIVEEDKRLEEIKEKLKNPEANFKTEKVSKEQKEKDMEEKAEKILKENEIEGEVFSPKKEVEGIVMTMEMTQPTVEDEIMEAKAYLTEATGMLLKLSKRLEKEGKAGTRFLNASREISNINNTKVIV